MTATYPVRTTSEIDILIFNDDTLHRVWQERGRSQTLDSPTLLHAMIISMVAENKRLRAELDVARDEAWAVA